MARTKHANEEIIETIEPGIPETMTETIDDVLTADGPVDASDSEHIMDEAGITETNIVSPDHYEKSETVTRDTGFRQSEEGMSIREIPGLDAEQRAMLLRNLIGKVLSRNMEPTIPTLIHYRLETVTPETAYGLIDIDARVLDEAWNLYVRNADRPNYRGFMELVAEFTGKRESRTIPRMGLLDLTRWA